ncbi:MAG: metallophosphoesterase [Candidatus Latescibacteria bacterium]|nr:metallophosphoesterase [Candidatus Latescibacterota bacterium]
MKFSQLHSADADSFTFALITDTHSEYDEFRDAVRHINSNPDIIFVIHAGDMTDYGLQEEYKWAVDILDDLAVPFFTVIGNHDCLANGKHIYTTMFGDTYYSRILSGHDSGMAFKFLFLNDNTLEYDIKPGETEKMLAWLENELVGGTDCRSIFVTAHVPPYSALYFTDEQEEFFRSLMARYNVLLFMTGHNHRFQYSEFYGDGVMYLRGDDIRDRNYCTVTVYPHMNTERGTPVLNVKRIYF